MTDNPGRMVRYQLTWPAWLAERVTAAARAQAQPVATWLREAALEKLGRAPGSDARLSASAGPAEAAALLFPDDKVVQAIMAQVHKPAEMRVREAAEWVARTPPV